MVESRPITLNLICPNDTLNQSTTTTSPSAVCNKKPRSGNGTTPTGPTTCLWCAHVYSTQPVLLRFISDRCVVSAIDKFCTYECAAAFNEYSTEFSHDKCQSYAELCHRYNQTNNTSCVVLKVAPSRLLLKMFGGPMSINKYRQGSTSVVSTVSLKVPEMHSITIEEYIYSNSVDNECPIDIYDMEINRQKKHKIQYTAKV